MKRQISARLSCSARAAVPSAQVRHRGSLGGVGTRTTLPHCTPGVVSLLCHPPLVRTKIRTLSPSARRAAANSMASRLPASPSGKYLKFLFIILPSPIATPKVTRNPPLPPCAPIASHGATNRPNNRPNYRLNIHGFTLTVSV